MGKRGNKNKKTKNMKNDESARAGELHGTEKNKANKLRESPLTE